ncbi:hypothetical protein NQ314_005471 [Rhamnusium bicolor]|uniref:Beta-glucuronidase n=1 Tax=Rhamnusium bicolor TaxID=1586634 RepID=A0AAV8ZJS0_9CUCU|nr:hypothetical protein NQ314_005471 [Rhamnusium bicolor]
MGLLVRNKMNRATVIYLIIFIQVSLGDIHRGGILFPRESETRQVVSLDGIWNFVVPNTSNPFVGFEQHWYKKDLREWINGQLVMSHEIGHLPFHREVTQYLKFGKENRVTVACDNTLLADTIPQGRVEELERPVKLYTTPKTYIDDISVLTIEVQTSSALLEYNVSVIGESNVTCRVSLIDKNKKVVANSGEYEESYGLLKIENPILWWPYLMHPEPGYQYTFQVELLDEFGDLIDKYSQPIGLRTVSWTNTSLLINNYPVYLHGFGRHEDSDIRGKGLDLPLIIRDHNLIKWVGANVYRTSHYPYAEEIMDIADEMGIMIIDECPSVNTEFFIESLLAKHKISLTELIKRDKNRPSVIMWSAANEPRTQFAQAKEYFRQIINHIKSLDQSRPTTIVEAQNVNVVESSRFVDIISFNRYNGWYSNEGNLDLVTDYVIREATAWNEKFNKPVIMQEYGGDTLEGLHFVCRNLMKVLTPNFIWSEEYQVNLLSKHFEAFDRLRASGFFIGEFIWNFADFKTAQTYTRVGGNKKGIFTRSRQPKASAHHLRKRYWGLAKEYYNATLPQDLTSYVISSQQALRDEL